MEVEPAAAGEAEGAAEGEQKSKKQKGTSRGEVIEGYYYKINEILTANRDREPVHRGYTTEDTTVVGCYDLGNALSTAAAGGATGNASVRKLVVLDGFKPDPNSKQTKLLRKFLEFDQVGDFPKSSPDHAADDAKKNLIQAIKESNFSKVSEHKQYASDRSNFFDKLLSELSYDADVMKKASKDELVKNREELSPQGTSTPSTSQQSSPGCGTLAILMNTPHASELMRQNVVDLKIGHDDDDIVPFMSVFGMPKELKGQPYFQIDLNWLSKQINEYGKYEKKTFRSFKRQKQKFDDERDKERKINMGKEILRGILTDIGFDVSEPKLSKYGKKWRDYRKAAMLVKVMSEAGIPLESQLLQDISLLLDPCSPIPQQMGDSTTSKILSLTGPKDYMKTPGFLFGSLGCQGQFANNKVTSMENYNPFLYDYTYKQGIFIMCDTNGDIEVIIYERLKRGAQLYLFPLEMLDKKPEMFKNQDNLTGLKTDKNTLQEIIDGKKNFCCYGVKVTEEEGKGITLSKLDEYYAYPPSSRDSHKHIRMLKDLKSFDDICVLIEHLSYRGSSELYTADNGLGILAQIVTAYEKPLGSGAGEWKKLDHGNNLKYAVITALRGQLRSRKLVVLNSNPKDVTLIDKLNFEVKQTNQSLKPLLVDVDGLKDLINRGNLKQGEFVNITGITKNYYHLPDDDNVVNLPNEITDDHIHPNDLILKLYLKLNLTSKKFINYENLRQVIQIINSKDITQDQKILKLSQIYSNYMNNIKYLLSGAYRKYITFIKKQNSSRRADQTLTDTFIEDFKKYYIELISISRIDKFAKIIPFLFRDDDEHVRQEIIHAFNKLECEIKENYEKESLPGLVELVKESLLDQIDEDFGDHSAAAGVPPSPGGGGDGGDGGGGGGTPAAVAPAPAPAAAAAALTNTPDLIKYVDDAASAAASALYIYATNPGTLEIVTFIVRAAEDAAKSSNNFAQGNHNALSSAIESAQRAIDAAKSLADDTPAAAPAAGGDTPAAGGDTPAAGGDTPAAGNTPNYVGPFAFSGTGTQTIDISLFQELVNQYTKKLIDTFKQETMKNGLKIENNQFFKDISYKIAYKIANMSKSDKISRSIAFRAAEMYGGYLGGRKTVRGNRRRKIRKGKSRKKTKIKTKRNTKKKETRKTKRTKKKRKTKRNKRKTKRKSNRRKRTKSK